MRRRYEYIGGSSRKFWEIDEPQRKGDDTWVVPVQFGRLGTAGQGHVKVFDYRSQAECYYYDKIHEKTGKGYKLKWPLPKSPTIYIPAAKPAPPPCEHKTLTLSGNTYQCASCRNKVEFNSKPKADTPEFQQKVRRFFASAS